MGAISPLGIFDPLGTFQEEKLMNIKRLAAACGLVSAFVVAMAAITFDPETGEGFVGKGDVQLVYGWNNRQLQQNALNVQFRAASEVVTEYTWECIKESPFERIRERSTSTTSTVEALVSSIARERNQITGFLLTGYEEGSFTSTTSTQGPALNTCPGVPWVYVEGSTESQIISSTGEGLQVSSDGTTWITLEVE
jgi:hypothetical protein